LTARLRAFQDQRIQIGASGVDRRGQARAAAPHDDYFFHTLI
jgi:hypothetical protein